MRIGIITFWESTDNYGQVLQAYALQQVLKDMGHEPYQIRYSLKASQTNIPQSSLLKKIIKLLLVYPLVISLKRRKKQREDLVCRTIIEEKNKIRKFHQFRNEYISQSERIYYSIEEIRKDPPIADCYITGSDQVWTMLLNIEGNNAYFLDFGDSSIKRIAYAASFGRSSYPADIQPILKEKLSKFDAISVREKEGVDICGMLGYRVDHVLDPTLLLGKKDYMQLKGSCKKQGLYVYSINIRHPKELYWSEVNKYAEENNQPITITTSSGNFPGREIFGRADYFYATIPEWIHSIDGAELVVTTSFHGVVFCLLFHTNFVYIPLNKKSKRGNGRVESLLKSVGLLRKICSSKQDFVKCVGECVNWNRVDELLECQRQYSLKFLNNYLK